ncbi:MAG: M15 family metallopeptidase [Clostridiales Family XIII bacterium]|nr:M15 family metallopeptidase [Clostridiales Family XIII bacterium]
MTPKRRRNRNRGIAIVVLTALVVLAFVYLFFFLGRGGSEAVGSSLTDGAVASGETAASADGPAASSLASADSGKSGAASDAGDDAADPEPAYPSYYDPALAARYDAFAQARPDLTEDEVWWMVGCDLDKAPYTDTQAVPDPNSELLLVNKHYYLPDDYVPADLVTIGATQLRQEAAEHLQAMIDAAAAEGLNLWAQSGYRGYGVQVSLYNQYSAADGAEAADTYSARPGYSEHQTGLTCDMNTITDAFGDTAEGRWVAAHAHEYGYIVRYTPENSDVTLYKYEPWHLRYIGTEAAARMHDEGIASFEEYWVKYVK